MKSRREEYSEATRRALLNSARELFEANGYAATSIEAVVQKARLTRGALYHHFKDKRQLFETLVIEIKEGVRDEITATAARKKTLWTQIEAGIEHFIQCCVRPEYRRIVIEDGIAILGMKRWREIDEEFLVNQLSRSLRKLIDQGEVKRYSAEIMARLIIAEVTEAAICIATAANADEAKKQALALIKNQLNALKK